MDDVRTFACLSMLLACAWAPAARGQASALLRLDATRDTWVSAVGREADGNNGAAPRLKAKSIQEMALVDIDPAPLRGRTVRSAALHLKKSGAERLWRVTVGGVGAEWFEGTGVDYAVQPGGATFHRRRHPDLPWSIGGGDLCHVVLGNGGTTWDMADASPPDRDGWQSVPVAPRAISARAAGLNHGLLVFDDTGSEWSRNGESFTFRLFPNRFVYSRDQNRASAPYFTVELGPADHQPPEAPAGLRGEAPPAPLPPGEALVSWAVPRDQGPAGTLGFFVELDGRPVPRELIPMAAAPGDRVTMHLRDLGLAAGAAVELSVRAVDAAANRGPAARTRVRLSDHVPTPLPRPVIDRRSGGSSDGRTSVPWPLSWKTAAGPVLVSIIDELDKFRPDADELVPSQPAEYLAVNHLWDAARRRVSLSAARNEIVAFQVLLRHPAPARAGAVRPSLVFEGAEGAKVRAEFGRYALVPAKGGPLPDPIVPLDAPTPAALTKNEGVHVEFLVPRDLPPGPRHGTLVLNRSAADGANGAGPALDDAPLTISVDLNVWDFTLPDHLSFLPEMNCYGLPENERDFYRTAHRHRTVLNRLPYSQGGQMASGCAPAWDARRGVLDWSAWDRRFGPLLDGSAFADLPRRGVPVECFYLPMHENWPTPMEGNYNGDYWADRAFPASYRRAFVSASRQFAEHCRSRGWAETLFQGFLNNKNNFKARGWSRGSSPWLLDEPASFQDYWALRYFARAFHEGTDQALAASARAGGTSPRMVFRADISRPQWLRDSLDGLLDYHVVGGAVRQYSRLVFERKRTFGEIVLEYGSTNPIEGSNVQPAAWCLDAWSLGTDGVVPWQTIGNSGSWGHADPLALIYPGHPKSGNRVVPSVRLKAYRRGQQDVEYLTLWSQLRREPRWAVGRQARKALSLAGVRRAAGGGADDAGRIDYDRLRPRDLWALRAAIGTEIASAHPAPKSKLVDFRAPPRAARRDEGHVVPKGIHE